jgi:hypothetical protein
MPAGRLDEMMNDVWCIGMAAINQTERPAIRIYRLIPRMDLIYVQYG